MRHNFCSLFSGLARLPEGGQAGAWMPAEGSQLLSTSKKRLVAWGVWDGLGCFMSGSTYLAWETAGLTRPGATHGRAEK